VDDGQRRRLIDEYGRGVDAVREALDGITDAELDHRPPDGWSPRQVVHHLADSEMRSAIRLRQLLAEDAATIQGYDEAGYASIFDYGSRDIGPAMLAFEGARATTAQLLARLSDDAWSRAGTHEENGAYSVEDWLRIYAAHGREHADQIRAARDELERASDSPAGR
jgi:hypothetical protein